MKRMEYALLALAGLAMVMVSGVPGYAASPQMTTVTALTSTPGHVETMAMDAFADVVRKNHPGLRVSSLPSQGYFYNLKILIDEPAKRKETIIGNSAPGMGFATAKKPPFTDGFKGVVMKHLWVAYSPVLLWATANPDIQAVYDLVGKRVANPPTAGGANMVLSSVLKAAGIFDKLGSISYSSLDTLHEFVLDGKSDACAIVNLANTMTGEAVAQAAVLQLSSLSKTVGYVSCGKSKEDVIAILARSPLAKSHNAVTLPVGSLPKQTREVYAVSEDNWIDADASMDENLVYEIVKARLVYHEALRAYGGLSAIQTKEYLCSIAQKDPGSFHPGALHAYREAGLLK